MRRFVFEDNEYEVKLTLDMPEEVFTLMVNSGKEKDQALKDMVIYTFEKGLNNVTQGWRQHQVDTP